MLEGHETADTPNCSGQGRGSRPIRCCSTRGRKILAGVPLDRNPPASPWGGGDQRACARRARSSSRPFPVHPYRVAGGKIPKTPARAAGGQGRAFPRRRRHTQARCRALRAAAGWRCRCCLRRARAGQFWRKPRPLKLTRRRPFPAGDPHQSGNKTGSSAGGKAVAALGPKKALQELRAARSISKAGMMMFFPAGQWQIFRLRRDPTTINPCGGARDHAMRLRGIASCRSTAATVASNRATSRRFLRSKEAAAMIRSLVRVDAGIEQGAVAGVPQNVAADQGQEARQSSAPASWGAQPSDMSLRAPAIGRGAESIRDQESADKGSKGVTAKISDRRP